MQNRDVTVTRILGQSFTVGPYTITLVAVNKSKARLVVNLPSEDVIVDEDDYKAIVESTLIMRDDHGWYRAIKRDTIELPPVYLGKNTENKDQS